MKEQREPEYVQEVTEGELNEKGGDKAVFDSGEFGGGNSDEELYAQAVAIVQNDKKASTQLYSASFENRLQSRGIPY